MHILYKVAVIYYGICAITGFLITPFMMCYLLYTQAVRAVQAEYCILMLPIGLLLMFIVAATLSVVKPLMSALYKAWANPPKE